MRPDRQDQQDQIIKIDQSLYGTSFGSTTDYVRYCHPVILMRGKCFIPSITITASAAPSGTLTDLTKSSGILTYRADQLEDSDTPWPSDLLSKRLHLVGSIATAKEVMCAKEVKKLMCQ